MHDYLIFTLAVFCALLSILYARLAGRVYRLEHRTRDAFQATENALNKGKTATRRQSGSGAQVNNLSTY